MALCTGSDFRCLIEMGRSSADAEVRPKNSAECSARFGSATCDYSAELSALWLLTCGVLPLLRTPLALAKVNILTVSY